MFKNKDKLKSILGGAVISTVGGPGKLGLKHSFDESSAFDRAAVLSLDQMTKDWIRYPFAPDGSDERQYCSPGIRIPTITICKNKYYEYPEYHTSLDNLDFVNASQILETFKVYVKWFEFLEMNQIYYRTNPYCEYQLGKRNLIPNLSGEICQRVGYEEGETHHTKSYGVEEEKISGIQIDAMSWLMFACDGKTDLLTIAEKSNLPLDVLHSTAQCMLSQGLLKY